jgi:hypothetical protein
MGPAAPPCCSYLKLNPYSHLNRACTFSCPSANIVDLNVVLQGRKVRCAQGNINDPLTSARLYGQKVRQELAVKLLRHLASTLFAHN